MQLAIVAAGFTPGEADQLRRSMAAWRRKGGLEKFEQRLVDGMGARGYAEAFARQIYQQILGFGEYGFPGIAFGVVRAARLRVVVAQALRAGGVLPARCSTRSRWASTRPRSSCGTRAGMASTCGRADVTISEWDCTLESACGAPVATACRRSLPRCARPAHGRRTRRKPVRSGSSPRGESRPFASVADLAHRAKLDRARPRRARRLPMRSRRSPAIATRRCGTSPASSGCRRCLRAARSTKRSPQLPAPTEGQDIVADYRAPRTHAAAVIRLRCCAASCASAGSPPPPRSQRAPHGRLVRTAGIVIGRQRPDTASGVMFVTLEDETGATNVIVWRDLGDRQRRELLGSRLIGVYGKVEREGDRRARARRPARRPDAAARRAAHPFGHGLVQPGTLSPLIVSAISSRPGSTSASTSPTRRCSSTTTSKRRGPTTTERVRVPAPRAREVVSLTACSPHGATRNPCALYLHPIMRLVMRLVTDQRTSRSRRTEGSHGRHAGSADRGTARGAHRAPAHAHGELELQPPPPLFAGEGAMSNVLMTAVPMVGSVGSVAFVAMTGKSVQSYLAAGAFLLASLGFVGVSIWRARSGKTAQVTEQPPRVPQLPQRYSRSRPPRRLRAAQAPHLDPPRTGRRSPRSPRRARGSGSAPPATSDWLLVRYARGPQRLGLELKPPESDTIDSSTRCRPRPCTGCSRRTGSCPTSRPRVALNSFSRIEITGAEDHARAQARALLVQAATFHAPTSWWSPSSPNPRRSRTGTGSSGSRTRRAVARPTPPGRAGWCAPTSTSWCRCCRPTSASAHGSGRRAPRSLRTSSWSSTTPPSRSVTRSSPRTASSA